MSANPVLVTLNLITGLRLGLLDFSTVQVFSLNDEFVQSCFEILEAEELLLRALA